MNLKLLKFFGNCFKCYRKEQVQSDLKSDENLHEINKSRERRYNQTKVKCKRYELIEEQAYGSDENY